MLRLDNGHNGNGNGHGNGDMQRSSERLAILQSADRISRNRRLINLAYRETTGENLLSPSGSGFNAIVASDAGKNSRSHDWTVPVPFCERRCVRPTS